MMKRILHVLWSPGFGGIARLVHNLVITQKCDPQLEIAVLFGKCRGEFLHMFRTSGVACYFADFISGWDFSVKKYNTAREIMASFDLLHFHSFNPLLALAAISTRKKTIYTIHGGFGFGRNQRISDAVNHILKERFLSKYVSCITFNSYFTQAFAERRYDIEKVDRTVVYNGIPLNNGVDTEHNVTDDLRLASHGKFVIGTTSRFAGFKRIDRLVEAFAKMQRDLNVVLLLVGDGPMRRPLEEAVVRAKLGSKVIFAGFQEDVTPFQRLMDVCVFPSEREPFGLVAVETLSLGKPVLVFRDGGGIVEVVKGVEPKDIVKDVAQLAERLAFYYHHPGEVTAKAPYRRAYARRFDIRKMADTFSQLYRQLIL